MTGMFTEKNGSIDRCWNQWTSYWSDHTANISTITAISNATTIITETDFVSQDDGSPTTFVTTMTSTNTVSDGGLPIATTTIVTTKSLTYTDHVSYVTKVSTHTMQFPADDTYITYLGRDALNCTLPAHVPQCETEWEAWVSRQVAAPPIKPETCARPEGNHPTYSTTTPCIKSFDDAYNSFYSMQASAKPRCSQASLPSHLCDELKDAYVTGNLNLIPKEFNFFGAFMSNGYLGFYNGFTRYTTWQTKASLGPSCTLGCGRCAVTGGSVELVYWPATTFSDLGANGPVTLSTLGTVLTSPTNYISYATLYASDACSGIGATHYNTIVPIPTELQLSSQFAEVPFHDAHVFEEVQPITLRTAPFNYTDLNTPVPYSIYTSQPFCVSEIFSLGIIDQKCATTRPYEPILVVPTAVFTNIDPAWATCSGDVRGVYDPPRALHEYATANAPEPATTTEGFPAPVQPTPATQPTFGQPRNTADHTAPQGPSSTAPNTGSPSAKPSSDSNVESGASSDPNSGNSNSADPSSDPNAESGANGDRDSRNSHGKGGAGGFNSGTGTGTNTRSNFDVGQGNNGDLSTSLTGDAMPPLPASAAGGNIASILAGGYGPSGSEPSSRSHGGSSQGQSDQNDHSNQANRNGISNSAGSLEQNAASDNSAVSEAGRSDRPEEGSSTTDLGNPEAASGQAVDLPAATITVGSQMFTAQAGRPFDMGSATLSAGGAVATVSGNILSAISNGIIVDGSTVAFSSANLPAGSQDDSQSTQNDAGMNGVTATSSFPITITIGSQTHTASPGHPFTFDGLTLTPGGPAATSAGEVVSVFPNGICVGTACYEYSVSGLISDALETPGNTFRTSDVVDGETFTQLQSGVWSVEGTTIRVSGPAITVDGDSFSAATNGNLVENGKTVVTADAVSSNGSGHEDSSASVRTSGSGASTPSPPSFITSAASATANSAASIMTGSLTLAVILGLLWSVLYAPYF
ncbi:MAG: hypothetical protein M1820_003802 [Bogoriella megaspora]|nr:MAG: hypothetical protein M1820_003802 [Bogoriella megaspora]